MCTIVAKVTGKLFRLPYLAKLLMTRRSGVSLSSSPSSDHLDFGQHTLLLSRNPPYPIFHVQNTSRCLSSDAAEHPQRVASTKNV